MRLLQAEMEQGALGDFRVSPRAQYLGSQLVMSSKANCFPCWKAWPQAMMGKYTKYWHKSTNGLPIPRKAGLYSHGSALQTQRSAHQNQQACMSCRVITQGMSQKLHGADGFYLRAISISKSAGVSLSSGFLQQLRLFCSPFLCILSLFSSSRRISN